MKKASKISKFFFIFTILVCAFSLTGCFGNENEENKHNNNDEINLNRYSVSSSQVTNPNMPTTKFDLSFLQNDNLEISSICFLDNYRILVFAVEPLRYNEDGNIPQKGCFYILNTGDSTLTKIYEAQLFAGRLEKLATGDIAIINFDSVFFLDINNPENSSYIDLANVISGLVGKDGKHVLNITQNKDIEIADYDGKVEYTLKHEDIGYDNISTINWSKKGDYFYILLGNDSYTINAILVFDMKNLSYRIYRTDTSDITPIWSDIGNELLIMKNFHTGDENLVPSCDIINLENGKLYKKYQFNEKQFDSALVFTDTEKERYISISNEILYTVDKDLNYSQISPNGLEVYVDNVVFTDNASKSAIFNINTGAIYLLSNN